MRKLALLLVSLTLGATALRLSVGSARASREAEAKPTPVAEDQPSRPTADLAEPAAVSKERSPLAPSPPAEPAIERTSSKPVTPSQLPAKTLIEGQFSGYPRAAEGTRAILVFEPSDPPTPFTPEVDVQPNWTVEVPSNLRGPCSVEGFTTEPPYLWSRRQELFIPSSPGRVAVTLELLPRTRLDGIIRDDGERPVANASVSLVSRYFAMPDSTDEFGGFSLLGELEGQHTFSVEADGFLDLEVSIDLGTSEVRYQEFILKRPMRVAGVIRWPYGAPAEDVSLFLRSRATGEQTDTDSEGRFDFTGGPAMNFVLYARAGGDSGQDFSGRFELDPERQDLRNLDLVLQRSPSVSGALVDDTGLAVPGINIELTAVDNSRVTREARTREDGTFTVSGLYPGTYRVTCSAAETVLANVEVEPGRNEPYLELQLPLPDRSAEPE